MCISRLQKFVQLRNHSVDLRDSGLLVRFLLIELIIDQSEVTLLLHTVVDSLCQNFFLVLLKLVDGVPDLLLYLLPCLFVLGDHDLDLLGQCFFGGFELIFLELVVT